MPGSEEKKATYRHIKACCEALEDKKGEDLIVLDLGGRSSITDYFIIASAKSEPHLKALRNTLRETFRKRQIELIGEESGTESGWLVVDAFDFMIHLFLPEIRERYRLESLWKDAEVLKIESPAAV